MEQKKIALLEFDEKRNSKTSPKQFSSTPKNLPERCVIAFSHTSVQEIAEKYAAKLIGEIHSCTVNIPIYEIDFEGMKIALTTGFIGSAGIAAQIEELHAGGVNKIIACGACGVLTPQPLGALVIPVSAVRDEGASFHYAPPSYEIQAEQNIVEHIVDTLTQLGLPFIKGKTWTTDAFYRETEDKIALRRSQNCLTVEMECAAMIAVTKFYDMDFGQILYSGDDLSGDGYDARNFSKAHDVRRNLIEYSLKCLKSL